MIVKFVLFSGIFGKLKRKWTFDLFFIRNWSNSFTNNVFFFVLAACFLISSASVRKRSCKYSVRWNIWFWFFFTQKLRPPGNFSWPLDSPKLCFAARFNLSLNIQYLKTDGVKEKENSSNFRMFFFLDQRNGEYSTRWKDLRNFFSFMWQRNITQNVFVHDEQSHSCFPSFHSRCKQHSIVNTHCRLLHDQWSRKFLSKFRSECSRSVKFLIENLRHSFICDFLFLFVFYSGTYHFSVSESAFAVVQNKSYQCNSKTTIDGFPMLTNASLLSIEFENLRIQPFADQSQNFNDFADGKIDQNEVFFSSFQFEFFSRSLYSWRRKKFQFSSDYCWCVSRCARGHCLGRLYDRPSTRSQRLSKRLNFSFSFLFDWNFVDFSYFSIPKSILSRCISKFHQMRRILCHRSSVQI